VGAGVGPVAGALVVSAVATGALDETCVLDDAESPPFGELAPFLCLL
jgi:hypothetical protein